jgi:hypothetical protein
MPASQPRTVGCRQLRRVIGGLRPNRAADVSRQRGGRQRIAVGGLLGQPQRAQTIDFCGLGRASLFGFRRGLA